MTLKTPPASPALQPQELGLQGRAQWGAQRMSCIGGGQALTQSSFLNSLAEVRKAFSVEQG